MNQQPVKIYFDSRWERTVEQDAVYYALVSEEQSQQDELYHHGAVCAYYVEGQMCMEGVYVNNQPDGLFSYYYPDGSLKARGRYGKGEGIGSWDHWHNSGQLHCQVRFVPGKDGKTSGQMVNMWDNDGSQLVKDGYGEAILRHKNGQVSERFQMCNGKCEGEACGFYEDGKPYYVDSCRRGELVKGISYSREGESFEYTELSVSPEPPANWTKDYLFRELESRFGSLIYNISGRIMVKLEVSIEGKISNVALIKGLREYDQLNQSVLDLMQHSPEWIPGTIRGQRTVSRCTLPVKFDGKPLPLEAPFDKLASKFRTILRRIIGQEK